ncbi:hypothetical protein GGR52DRAFT_404263 [Hypoxylon sp. FL1284]|nr:hypothetical protein GGR52DRAFT_404263 [Hypoxylon sp. FL1284]
MAAAVQVAPSSASSAHQQASPSTAPVLDYVCLFTHDLRRKQKRWQDGRLKYHTFNRRIMVHDERGNFVGDMHWREDYDLGEGDELELERGGTLVQVAECTGSRDQDLSELVDKRAQEKAERQAAMARRHPTHQPATPSAAAPHFQLLHKPLHRLIGTPTGHHGRALMPTESPYEERQKLIAPQQSESARPAKRRKRELSPPSKSGYAQSLFGASLTLSGTPASTPLIRSKPRRSSPILVDDQSPPPPNRAPNDNCSDPIPEPARTIVADLPREKRVNAPRPQLLKSIARTRICPPQQITGPESLPISIGVDSDCDEELNSSAHTTQPKLNRRKETINHNRKSDLPQPTSPNRSDLPESRGKPDLVSDASSSVPLGNNASARGMGSSARNQRPPSRSKPKETREPRNSHYGTRDAMQEHLANKPRTELRIRPRKKTGLLMVAEGVSVDKLPGSRAKNRINRPRPSPPLESFATGILDAVPDKENSTTIGIGEKEGHRPRRDGVVRSSDNNRPKVSSITRDTEDDDVPSKEPKKNGDRGTRKTQILDAEDFAAGPNALSHIIEDDSSEEEVSDRKRRKADSRRVRSPSPPQEDSDLSEPPGYPRRKQPPRKKRLRRRSEEESDEDQTNPNEGASPLPDDVLPPRLAPLGRKGLRSKEIIGFMFDEDDDDGAVRRGEVRGEGDRKGLVRSQSMVQSATRAAKCADSATTNNQVTTMNQSSDHDLGRKASRSFYDTRTGSVERGDTIAPGAEIAEHGREQKQATPAPVPVSTNAGPDMEPDIEVRVSGKTAVAHQQMQPSSKRVPNPATRGKKAAKPSDAAGQVPQCPLPMEMAVGNALESSRQKSRLQERLKESSIAPMPGFSRANGGPWSREAHDLFEFTRPS